MFQKKQFWFYTIGIWVIGAAGGIFSLNAKEYYKVLELPSFSPPAWLFGPVWTILYLLMGITFFIITEITDERVKKTLRTLFITQFILNFIWSPIFFMLKSNLLAVIVITILWFVLLALQLIGLRKKPVVMWLMGPYFLWVSFASVLSYAILFLNGM